MLNNPDTLALLRLQLTAVVVAILLFLANLPDDDPPAASPQMASGEPLKDATYEPWPITEQQYEMFDMAFPTQKQDDYFSKETDYLNGRNPWDGLCV